MHRPGRLATALALTLVLSTASPMVLAADAVAEKLFDDGKALMIAKNFAEACPKLEQSQHLDPSEGTTFALAYCLENNGQLVSAWLTYKDGRASAKKSGNGQRLELANQRIALLEPRLSTLTITVPSGMTNAVVTIDGKAFVAGTAVPIDGGKHAVRVTADGKSPFESTVEVGIEKDKKTVTVPALTDAPSTSATTTKLGGDAQKTPTVAYVMVVTGVVFTLGAVGGQLAASGAHDARRTDCIAELATACDDTGKGKVRTFEALSFVSAGLAVASFGTAIYLFASSGKKEPTAAPHAYVRVVPQLGGFQLQGAF